MLFSLNTVKKACDMNDWHTLFSVSEEFRVDRKMRKILPQALTETVSKVKFCANLL